MRKALCLLCPGSLLGLQNIRSLVVSILVMVWALRIAGFLFLRVLVTGSDTRFDSISVSLLELKGFWIVRLVHLSCQHVSEQSYPCLLGQCSGSSKSTFLLLRIALFACPILALGTLTFSTEKEE
ncbi:hypothetical protein BKA62DRAFT_837682 [Auriculariales sp. MPI-PUGE-AT-0066]|nr:hypothetical protein BKA62DRAFT_837682 [Auriculariales sp. MPI-PUGE-AT-0066]